MHSGTLNRRMCPGKLSFTTAFGWSEEQVERLNDLELVVSFPELLRRHQNDDLGSLGKADLVSCIEKLFFFFRLLTPNLNSKECVLRSVLQDFFGTPRPLPPPLPGMQSLFDYSLSFYLHRCTHRSQLSGKKKGFSKISL